MTIALIVHVGGNLLRAMIALFVGVILFGGSGAPTYAQVPQYGGVLQVGIENDVRTLDPTFQVTFSERQPIYLIYNTLFGLTEDFSIIPELAVGWAFSDDGLTLTLHLREGVKFHDLTDFDASSVKWNFDRRLSDKLTSPSGTELRRIISVVEVVNPLTVQIHMKVPSPSLLGMLAQREGFMVSPTSAEKFGDSFGRHPVGTGPFVFKEWLQNRRIVVERNPNYWDPGKPYLEGVVFHLLANSTVGIPRMLTGELDILSYLTPNQVLSLIGKPDVRLRVNKGTRWVSLHMNTSIPPFNDVRVRKAIAYGLDRKKIAAIATGGKGVVANGPTPPDMWWFNKDLPNYPYDPEMAKKLLAEAGHRAGLALTLSIPPDTQYRQIAALAQEQLQEVGIKVKIDPVSASMWAELLMNGIINFLPMRWTQRPDPDGLLSAVLESGASQNWVRFKNSEFDRLLEMGRIEKDRDLRHEIYNQAQKILAQELPYINLFFAVEYTAMRSRVQNYTSIPDAIPRFRDIWISK